MRKQMPQKHQNHERWIISYADFTTLLLATFVVMYAVSSINSSKFQAMAEAFSTAFMGNVTKIEGTGAAAAHKAPFENLPSPVHAPIVTRQPQIEHLPPGLRQAMVKRAETLNKAYHELLTLLGPLIKEGRVKVSMQPLGIVIDINSVILFQSGQAVLSQDATDILDRVAGIIKELNFPVQVNGFTDNQPIHTGQFDSNWDLSAARAIAVVKRFAEAGIDPHLLVGAGYGEYHPLAKNDTPDGMAANRRVSIVAVSPLQDQKPENPLLGDPEGRNAAAEREAPGPQAATGAAGQQAILPPAASPAPPPATTAR